MEKKKIILHIKLGTESSGYVKYSVDEQYIYSGNKNGELIVWDSKTGDYIKTIGSSGDDIIFITCSDDGKYIARGGYEGTIKLFNIISGEEMTLMDEDEQPDWVNFILFDSIKEKIISSYENGKIIIWDIKTGEIILSFKGHKGRAKEITYIPDGERIISGGGDGTIKIWDVKSGKCVKELFFNENFKGMDIKIAKGLSKEQLKFFKERGVKLDSKQTASLKKWEEYRDIDEDKLESMTMKKLKEVCEELGLNKSGRKSELIEKILELKSVQNKVL